MHNAKADAGTSSLPSNLQNKSVLQNLKNFNFTPIAHPLDTFHSFRPLNNDQHSKSSSTTPIKGYFKKFNFPQLHTP
jgi:hypothetical protein